MRKRSARHEKRKFQEQGVPVSKGKPGCKKVSSKKPIIRIIPDGETEETLENQRKKLVEMYRKGTQDLSQVKLLMDNTFSKRRRDVLLGRVWKVLQDYPFLKDDKGIQMKAELARILDKENLVKDMREEWEVKKPVILSALKRSHCSNIQKQPC